MSFLYSIVQLNYYQMAFKRVSYLVFFGQCKLLFTSIPVVDCAVRYFKRTHSRRYWSILELGIHATDEYLAGSICV